MKDFDIIIKNTNYLDTDLNIKESKDIYIKDGKIKHIIDTNCVSEDKISSDTTIDGKDLLWMPGLTDGHCHLSQQFLRGRLLDERPLIYKRINVPFESKLSKDDIELSTKFASCEMIKNGITSFLDAGTRHADTAYETLKNIGIRAGISWQTTDSESAPKEMQVTVKDALKRNEELIEKTRKEKSLVKYFSSITAPTACSEEMILSIFKQAKELDSYSEVHMNEYSTEVTSFIEKYEIRPFEYFEKNNLLSEKMVAAHSIYLNPNEMDIIHNHDIKVIHCPFSNCGKGVPETPSLLSRGIDVGFGSDGSGHGGIDLFQEIRLFRSIMNLTYGIKYGDYKVMPAKKLISMATVNGVTKLLDDNIKGITEGGTADMISIDLNNICIYPTNNLVNTLLESVTGMHVNDSIIDGKVVMKDRELKTLDEQKVLHDSKAFLLKS